MFSSDTGTHVNLIIRGKGRTTDFDTSKTVLGQ